MSCVGYSAYVITNSATGAVYVGITTGCITRRLHCHFSAASKGRDSHLGAAIREHGEQCFAVTKIASSWSWLSLGKLEQSLVAQYRSSGLCYNASVGGRSVRPHAGFEFDAAGRCTCRSAVAPDRDISSVLASNIRELRGAMGLTQLDVARRAGLTHGHVHKLESGACSNPSLATAMAIARALGTSLDRLVGDAGERTASHFHGSKPDTSVGDFQFRLQ